MQHTRKKKEVAENDAAGAAMRFDRGG